MVLAEDGTNGSSSLLELEQDRAAFASQHIGGGTLPQPRINAVECLQIERDFGDVGLVNGWRHRRTAADQRFQEIEHPGFLWGLWVAGSYNRAVFFGERLML